MSVEYYYGNDLDRLYNAAVGDKTDGGEHHMRMMEAHENLEAYVQKLEHWKYTALQLSRNNGEAQAKIQALEAHYVISNRELLIKQVEIARLTAELAELRERTRWRKYPDEKPGRDQTVLIYDGSVYVSTYFRDGFTDSDGWLTSDDPDYWMPLPEPPEAFTKIDKSITNYNSAVSAGKVSVDVKPVQRPAGPSLEEDEFDSMPIEKINQYLREHGYNPEKVGLRGKILVEALTKNIIAREIIQRFLNNEGGCRFCDYDKYLPLGAPENGHEENCLYLAARAYLDNDTSTVVKRDLSDAEIEELGAQEAESRGDK